ncbi:hypothetical protein CKM354_000614900 [Cercospora kikuchii]|uniref:DUF7730 domain-containing protein n=1 Tax=Cercospora kikuchii TaxID=84275 RepID=A0A9P3FD16_9PEZI|nr:uncharacterized protein CKM354_000614900 [Cercospora kikuchii]GIZ42901.1 hypothetical protein CKM354_000614900 [Cercospora kikuchii]
MATYISKRTESQTQSVFFKLSAELRNEVYYHAFSMQDTDATEVHLCPKEARVATKDSSATKHEGINLALLATCRRIYHEAIGVCYGIDPIGIDRNMIYRLRDEFSRARLGNIRTLRVHVDSPDALLSVCGMVSIWVPAVETLDIVFDSGIDTEFNRQICRPYMVHSILRAAVVFASTYISKLKTVSKIKLMVGHMTDLFPTPDQADRMAVIRMQKDSMATSGLWALEEELNALLPKNKARIDAAKAEESEAIESEDKD